MIDHNYTKELRERCAAISLRLLEMGVPSHHVDSATAFYFSTVGFMVAGARNLATFSHVVAKVEIRELDAANLKTVVTRNGKEWGKIELSKGEKLRFVFDTDTKDPQMHTKGDLEIRDV